MAELTLEEKVFLLSRNPTTGRDRATYGIDAALGGAVLIALARRGCIQVVDKRVSRENAPGPAEPLHREALSLIESDGKERKAQRWVETLPRKLKLQERLGVGLAEKGLVEDGRTRFLGITQKKFPRTETGDEVVRPIERAVVDALTGVDPAPTEETKLLAALLAAAQLLNRFVERPDRKAARARAEAFTAEEPINDAVAGSVKAAEAAIVATIATVAAAGATSGT
ncbi:GOLPH3/VPS74 family protein [Pseudonocardia pini]|uniref:GOLPH3/VPS74 family protein n=1 Tax=Pseudonocardia pini TaxID=2758030 RepID=UPI0015F0EA07|nr:GPP34 family phosphoprotein [Pseudonocardia pini]